MPRAESRPGRRLDAAASAAAAIVPLALFVATLHPGLPGGDSGELITAAFTGGVAHPPGYPLYVLLAGAWAHLVPWGSVALRFNLFSALATSAAAMVLALAVVRFTRSRAAGFAAAWTFAFAIPVRANAIVAEVFALNALMAAGVLLALAVTTTAPPGPAGAVSRRRASAAAAFLTVASLSHHHTLLMLALPATVAAFVRAWRADSGARGLLVRDVGLAKAVALLPLLWLPLASRHAGALVWGDATTFRGFASLLLRADYGTFRLDPVQAGMHADRSHALIFLRALPRNFGVPALALAAIGVAVGIQRHRGFTAVLAAFAVLQWLFFARVGFPSGSPLLRGVVERFYELPLIVLACLTGLGAAAVLGRLPRGGSAVRFASVALCGLLLVPSFLSRDPRVDQRGNGFVEALGRGMLASLPPHAVLFVQGDLLHNACTYLTRIEHLRPDVTVLDQELMTYAWYVRRARREHPGLLPSLGGAHRVVRAAGESLDGWAQPRPDGRLDVLEENGQVTLDAADVARVDTIPAAGAFSRARAAFRSGFLTEPSDDRYSGLPGTRALLWLDHLERLRPARPAAFVGVKDASWTLRFSMTPVGFVAWARPASTPPTVAEQAGVTLSVLEAFDASTYFRTYDPTSFEAAERGRIPAVLGRAALVLSQPQAAESLAAHPRGHAALLSFARAFEPLEPTPDPACLRAFGFLRLFDPAFRDPAVARADLARYVASGAPGSNADPEVREALARLAKGPGGVTNP